jgi:hypothetical protein
MHGPMNIKFVIIFLFIPPWRWPRGVLNLTRGRPGQVNNLSPLESTFFTFFRRNMALAIFLNSVPKSWVVFGDIFSSVETWVYQHHTRTSDYSSDFLAPLLGWRSGSFQAGLPRRKNWSDERNYNPVHPTSPFLTGAQDSHLQRVRIPEAAYIQ